LSALPVLTFGAEGPIPTPPDTLNADLISYVASTVPDYTADLPGGLIEDLSSTGTGVLVSVDQARVEAVNNLSPSTANPYVLNQLGATFGIPQGLAANTSVLVVFSGPAGYVIPAGFIVSDGTYQYQVVDGGVIGSSGTSASLFAVSTQSGSWTPLVNSVTTIVTSVPSGYTLTVTNPVSGTPGLAPQSVASYRGQVMGAFSGVAQGYADYIKALLVAVPGVTPRLVSVVQVTNGWKIIVGGGDPYAVGGAIYLGTIDLSTLQGSSTTGRNVTVSIVSPPNSYAVPYVNPPVMPFSMDVTWNTTLPSFTAGTQVNQLGQTAMIGYINSIPVGNPINLEYASYLFQEAISSVLSQDLLTTLEFSVYINGVLTPPDAGTSIVTYDSETYLLATATDVSVAQG